MNEKTKANIIANVLARVWGMVSLFVFIPFYIKYLGTDLYGLMSFFAVLQSIMMIMGAGFSATLRREFSVFAENEEEKTKKHKLLNIVEKIYMVLAVTIIFLIYNLSDFIAANWLNVGAIKISIVSNSITLMGFSIGFQLLSNLYTGCLLGIGCQVKANVYQAIWSLLRNLFAIAAIIFIEPNIILFYLIQIIIDFIYLCVLRIIIFKQLTLKKTYKLIFSDFKLLKDIWKYSVGILGITIISTFNTKIDKIFVSNMFELKYVGAYSAGYALSQIPSMLVSSIMVAIFNEFIYANSTKDVQKQKELFYSYYKKIMIISICFSAYMALFSDELLYFWLNNSALVDIAKLPTSILLVGSVFLTCQIVPYYYLLASNNTLYNNIIGLAGIVLSLLILPYLSKKYGLVGTAIAYSVTMFISAIFLLLLTYRKYLLASRIFCIRWIIFDNVIPFVSIFGIAFFSRTLISQYDLNIYLKIIYAIISGAITLFGSYYFFIVKFNSNKQY